MLLVESTTSLTIREKLRRDLYRLADGRTDGLNPITGEFLEKLNSEDLAIDVRCRHALPDCAAKNGKSIAVKSLHEAWRYGKSLDHTKEEASEAALRRIMQWITLELEVGV